MTGGSHLDEKNIIALIKNTVRKNNYDNISRTQSYQDFFLRHPEIKWSFMASMVSRNAGYCMTDLKGVWFQKLLDEKTRKALFLTYEDANWLIFSDAYPQLLLYEWSKTAGKPLFHLLDAFHVSAFMKKEWVLFWERGDMERLMTSLIINEQHLIQKPVIEGTVFKRKVFGTPFFLFQDLFHFSTVIFPGEGGRLYGFSVHDFRKLKSRIRLGRSLAWLLFHPDYYGEFLTFAAKTVHTGSRADYEPSSRLRMTPYLRTAFPFVSHQLDEKKRKWFHGQPLDRWYRPIPVPETIDLTDWLIKKENQLHALAIANEYVQAKRKKI
ncbi:DUF2515 domain-containing protein [Metabacillus indicus]|uniref:DUF2515 domain-containing protein n=1 Tax=Metabacillus indicus TaxID=246786 RepID=UPI000493034E|nr:DUF2515 domain-containing protein [Metabacillus indicus]KEZ50679.1 hypothetical protein AZ46_0208475 [Metabacillus indicus LMG 22858]